VSVRELASLNGLRSQHQIRAGQRLRLPEPAGTRTVAAIDRSDVEAPRVAPVDGTYAVRRGDSLARIASRFGVSEQDLLDWNPIRNRHRIAVGQRLRVAPPLPDAELPAIALAEATPMAAFEGSELEEAALPGVALADADIEALEAVALEPASPAATPRAAGTSPGEDAEPVALAALLPDRLAAFTSPAESDADLGAPSETTAAASVADAAAAELARGGPADAALVADPADYSVAADGTIEVQAAETLGHYAEWLDVRASRLRSLNRMRYGTPLAIGARLRLDFAHVSQQEFEVRRTEHHRALQGEFFERFEIDGTATHTVRRGDSIWQIAERRYGVPIWLLRQYNPDLDFADLQAGEPVTVPQLRPR
jgi:membrane-bound lytic murein transglycosylase D